MAEIAGAAREGLLALAVGTGLQVVMAAMFEEDVTRLRGPDGKHNPSRAGYRHGTEAGSASWAAETPGARAIGGTMKIMEHRDVTG
jgi:putative transposase